MATRKKILIALANPKGAKHLEYLKEEWIAISTLFSDYREYVLVDSDLEASYSSIKTKLQEAKNNDEPFTHLHFSGHSKQDHILLNSGVDSESFSQKEFCSMLSLFNIEFIFLNSCHSISFAQELKKTAKVQVVIGTTQSVGDKASFFWARAYYKHLLAMESYSQAFHSTLATLSENLNTSNYPIKLRDILNLPGIERDQPHRHWTIEIKENSDGQPIINHLIAPYSNLLGTDAAKNCDYKVYCIYEKKLDHHFTTFKSGVENKYTNEIVVSGLWRKGNPFLNENVVTKEIEASNILVLFLTDQGLKEVFQKYNFLVQLVEKYPQKKLLLNVSSAIELAYFEKICKVSNAEMIPSSRDINFYINAFNSIGEAYKNIIIPFSTHIFDNIKNEIEDQKEYISEIDLVDPIKDFLRAFFNNNGKFVGSKFNLVNLSGTSKCGLNLLLNKCLNIYYKKCSSTEPEIWPIQAALKEEEYWKQLDERLNGDLDYDFTAKLLSRQLREKDVFLLVDFVTKDHNLDKTITQVALQTFINDLITSLHNSRKLPTYHFFIFIYTEKKMDLSNLNGGLEHFNITQLSTIEQFDNKAFDDWIPVDSRKERVLASVVAKKPPLPDFLENVILHICDTLGFSANDKHEFTSLNF